MTCLHIIYVYISDLFSDILYVCEWFICNQNIYIWMTYLQAIYVCVNTDCFTFCCVNVF